MCAFLGPNCRNKHVRKLVCQNYLTGFCPDGLNCPNGHPKYELPVMYNAQDSDQQQQMQQQQSHFNTQQNDNKPSYNNNRHHNPQQQQQHYQNQQHHNQGGGGQQQQGNFRKLEDVTCYKCGQQGHYANRCTQGRKQQ